MSEYPTFGENYDHYLAQDTRSGEPTVGYIVGINHQTHRVDVQLPEYGNIIVPDVRVGTPWHAGSGTGVHAIPPLFAEVKISFRKGKSAGFTGADVDHAVYSADWKPPSHPSLAGQTNFHAIQTAIITGNDVTPGSLELLDDQGGKHSLVMGKRVERGRGQTDKRHDGLSITHAESQMMEASNHTALAEMKAQALDPTGDLNALSRGLASVSDSFAQANRATSSATAAFGDQVVGHAQALAVGTNAGALAEGAALPDSLI